MSRFTISVGEDGSLRWIYDDRLAGLPAAVGAPEDASTRRVSHVEPAAGGWMADLSPVNGPLLGPFALRQQALDAEIDWLKEHYL